MKKINYLELIMMLFFIFFQAILFAQNKDLSINVAIGRQGADCRGRGICSFNVVNSEKNVCNAIAIINNDHSITLKIKRDMISQEYNIKIGANPRNEKVTNDQCIFEMEEAFIWDIELKSSLKIPSQYSMIPKGDYPLEITSDSFTITFKLE